MKSTELTALVVAASLLVGGTYAWNAISQRAINETVDGTKEAGGRLHDDFNGENKDVYVENYAPLGSGEDLYARIRIREYFEYGELAGDITGSSSSDIKQYRGDKQVAITPEIDDVDTWDIYLYGSTPTMGVDTIRSYRDLEFAGSTIYLPTFNQDNTDLTADINGTLEGALSLGRGDATESYTDYKTYTSGVAYPGNLVTVDNPAGTSTTHTAKETLDSTIMTMADWISGGTEAGNYWVYDADGWAYWAQPITPNTATGLLLDGIDVKGNTDERWYYAVEVEAQIATAGDWGDDSLDTGMYGDITNDGLGLLNKISGLLKVSSLVVTNNGATIVNPTFSMAYVESLNLIPEVTVEYGTGASYETEVEWSITEIVGSSGVTLDSSIFNNGTFNPTVDMIGSTYEITVTSTLTPSRTITYTITVTDLPDAIEIVTEDDLIDVKNTETLQLYAYEENTTNPVSVTWSIVKTSGSGSFTQDQIDACLDENGLFTPLESMAGCTFTVTATTPYPSIAPATKVISVYDASSVSIAVNAAGNATSMTLSPENHTLQMSATVTGLIDQRVMWTVTDNNGTSGMSQMALNACMGEDGVFSPADAMAGGSYTITATSIAHGSLVGTRTISITAPTVTVSTTSTNTNLDDGDEIQFTATVSGLIDTDDVSLEWTLDDTSKLGASINNTGLVSVTDNASLPGNVVITATIVGNATATGSATISLGYRIPGSTYAELNGIKGTTTTVRADGIDYYVLDAKSVTRRSTTGASEGNVSAVLLWVTDRVTINGAITSKFHSSNVSTWSSSTMNTTTLPDWMAEQTNLVSRVVRVSVSTDGYYKTATQTVGDGSVSPVTTYNEAWLLSQPEYLSYIGTSGDARGKASGMCWLRSPYAATTVRYVNSAGTSSSDNSASISYGVRPALWVVP